MNFLHSNSPLISVAIATFDRGSKIESTLKSVQSQTLSNFEVLIVSDGPASEDLRRTVEKFDNRFKLLQLPERSGSQSGPNNFARDQAEGEILAYLGHDDIWHPRHLEYLDSVASENPNADFIVSGCLIIGPNGMVNELTWSTGFFPDPGVHAGLENFFPPSSVAHRISTDKPLPYWQDALSTSAPVDSAFMKEAANQGFSFFSTNKISVFKFNSAFRYLSYLLPNDSEQVAMLKICEKSEVLEDFIRVKLDISKSNGAFMNMKHPDSEKFEKGEITKKYAKVRGISEVKVQKISQKIVIKMIDNDCGYDWHPLESNGYGSWRWSGPSSSPRLAIMYTADSPVQITLGIRSFITEQIRESLALFINNDPVQFEILPPNELEPWKVTAMGNLVRRKGSVLELRTSQTCAPCEIDPNSKDARKLGLSLESIEIRPLIK